MLILVTEENIRKPTMTRAGAVAKEGMAMKKGEKNRESRNSTATVMAVSPVRPPSGLRCRWRRHRPSGLL